MTFLLLDTSIVIDALRNRNSRRKALAALVRSGCELAVSTISVGEVYAGIRGGEESKTAEFFAGIRILPVNSDIARRAGILRRDLQRSGDARGLVDMIIAATALVLQVPLATDNVKDFQLPGLLLHSIAGTSDQ